MDEYRRYRTAALDDYRRYNYEYNDQFRYDEDFWRPVSRLDTLAASAVLIFIAALLATTVGNASSAAELAAQVALAIGSAAGAVALLWDAIRSSWPANRSRTKSGEAESFQHGLEEDHVDPISRAA